MNWSIHHLFAFSILTISPIIASQHDLSHLIKVSSKRHCSSEKRYHKQQALINRLKSEKTLDVRTLEKCINALMIEEHFPLLTDHIEIIIAGIKFFHKNSHFLSTLQTCLLHLTNPETAKGFLYEIELAVRIVKEFGHIIEAFNTIKCSPLSGCSHQFDIITSNCWYECKNINHWPIGKKRSKKLKKQFEEQQRIVREYNEINDPVAFIVCSKQIIPKPWQEWFEQNGIGYIMDDESV